MLGIVGDKGPDKTAWLLKLDALSTACILECNTVSEHFGGAVLR